MTLLPLNLSEPAKIRLAALLVVLAVFAAYANSFGGVFVFDDIPAIVENPTIRPPWHWAAVLAPPGDQAGSVGGRPLVNLSLALNYAVSGLHPWSYHVFNLLVQVLAAMTLFGVLRRTLGRVGIATAISLIWAVHPLQTEAVTYVIQRAESLMALFYLFALYGFIRAADAGAPAARSRRRLILSWAACAAGMATKEVMFSAPLLVLLYDRTFASGSFREAWRRRKGYYCALAGTWLLLAALVAQTAGRGGSAGFESSAGVWPYLLTQCRAIGLYLRLSLWPHPLVFDYGLALVTDPAAVLLQGFVFLVLMAATLVALVRRPVWGFIGAAFFAILAPSSSFVPIATEPIAEHRMYLPLALVVAVVVLGAERALRRLGLVGIGGGIVGVVAVALIVTTADRNRAYASEVTLWSDTVAKMPDNTRAHNDLGTALDAAGDASGATAQFADAVAIDPGYAPAQYDFGVTLLRTDRAAEALPHLEKALGAPRRQVELRLFLAQALAKLGRPAEAAARDAEALKLAPTNLAAAFDWGNNLAAAGRYAEAADAFGRSATLAPTNALVKTNWATALLYSGRVDEAIAEYESVLSIKPDDATARQNLNLALQVKSGRVQLR
ncbi:MAG TPA: tetratricopeptide repeat protein [Opitutaceae bacterium]|jgi:Flp pilus assembly protein TadD